MNNFPNVVIVGKPNVGKSTLFNRLIGKRISITHNEEGVTRDRIYHLCEWMERKFNLIDTGGILRNLKLNFQEEINSQVNIAISESDIIVFLFSGREQPTKEDFFISSMLRKIKNKKIILVANKIDDKKLEEGIFDYYKFGLGEPIPISSIHGIGINNLLDEIVNNIENKDYQNNLDLLKIGIIGKPNVGKSTLLNTLLNEERVIVSNKPGTTRDSIDTFVSYDKRDYIFVDTAGIKKNKKSLSDVEFYAELRSNLTILKSNIVILLLDYKLGFDFIDEKIMGILKENLKPTLIFVNKEDQLLPEEKKEINFLIKEKFPFASWIEFNFISAKNGKNVKKIFEKINEIDERRQIQINKKKLNKFLFDIQIIKKPPRHNGNIIKLSYITFVNNDFPHFIIFSNNAENIHFSYKRFIENQIRNAFDLRGIPIKISFRSKK